MILPFSIWYFIVGSIVLLFSTSLGEVALINLVLQGSLFFLVVCIPIWRTGRMSYVDIAWPWGLVLIAITTFFVIDQGYWLRKILVVAVYLLIGLRMGVGALVSWHKGHLQTEFPRYQYQQLRWQQAGLTNYKTQMFKEAVAQGFANTSFLCLPAFVIAINPNPEFSIVEIIGLIIWLAAYVMETVADKQKVIFIANMKEQDKTKQVCDYGLWKYSRHPNYFAEWMVWNGLVIAAIPSWLAMYSTESYPMWCFIGVGLLAASYFMFATLVSYTGAIPAEYYSALRRPGYRQYQATTNMFFPGPRKISH